MHPMKYGINSSTMKINLSKIFQPLQCKNMRNFNQKMKIGKVSRSNLREVLQLSVRNNKVGIPTYLSPDKEVFVIAEVEIEVYHRLPINTALISDELQGVFESVKSIPTCKGIPPQ